MHPPIATTAIATTQYGSFIIHDNALSVIPTSLTFLISFFITFIASLNSKIAIENVAKSGSYSDTFCYRFGNIAIFRINYYGSSISSGTTIATLTDYKATSYSFGALAGQDDGYAIPISIAENSSAIKVDRTLPQNKRYKGQMVFIITEK